MEELIMLMLIELIFAPILDKSIFIVENYEFTGRKVLDVLVIHWIYWERKVKQMLIAIDNGHGFNTPGKRTPTMPDGRVIKEWEFNYPTAKKLGEILKYNGFNILFVSDTAEDTPLNMRTDKANQAEADIFVSIHFNAFQGLWGSHGGIETLYLQGSTNGLKLANLVQKELIDATGLRNRGAKARNDLWVLNRTRMPAIIAECGFMDNLEEAKLMIDENYQMECARAIAKGICKYFGVEYKESITEYSPWAVEAMEWAMKSGLTDGTNPKEPISLERFITILYRYNKTLE